MKIIPLLKKILIAILLFTIGVSLLSLVLEKHIFYAHLFVHFQLQYFIIIATCSTLLLFFPKKLYAIVGFIFTLIFYILWIHKISFFSGDLETTDILFLNSQYDSSRMDRTLNLIEQLKPTTISLVESNPNLIKKIIPLKNEPVLNHRAYASSCTVFSELRTNEQKVLGKNHLPICIVSFANFDLITVHPHRPMNPAILQENLQFFDELSTVIQEYESKKQKFIVVGDFNSTYYSAYFRERFGRYDQKIISTWMAGTPLALPIDHVLTNMQVRVERSPQVGSDHRALLIDVLEKF
jgi:hypothetical protein